jgi:HEPN domain-containing protein
MIEFYKAWILKAQSDLKSAEVMVRRDDPITDTAIYHTQQCAEKALKGFLAYRQSEIQKIHHLVKLVELCATLDSDFDSLLDDADELTPMGTEFRYPDDFDVIDDISQLFPTVEEVEEAIAKAKRILDFVLSKLPSRSIG